MAAIYAVTLKLLKNGRKKISEAEIRRFSLKIRYFSRLSFRLSFHKGFKRLPSLLPDNPAKLQSKSLANIKLIGHKLQFK